MIIINQVPNLSHLSCVLKNNPNLKIGTLKYESFFRNAVDLLHIDTVAQRIINENKKLNLALIGLGKSGIEPLSVLTQMLLTARRNGKKLSDLTGKIEFVDLDLPENIKHSPAIVRMLSIKGQNQFVSLYNGLAPKEIDEIYSTFTNTLSSCRNRYLGHSVEDFIDEKINHNLFDLTFCNNVFYYVGRGSEKSGLKYSYITPMESHFYTPVSSGRYLEVLNNLLSTVRQNGRLFFHHNADIGDNVLTRELKLFVNKEKSDFIQIAPDIYTRLAK